MKKLCMIAMVAVLGLSALAPSAQAMGVMASWWNMDKANDDGFGFGIVNRFNITPLFAFDTRASWIKFKDADTDIFPIEATAMVNIALVYGGVGVGYYIFNTSGSVSLDNDFGWYALAGAHLGVGPVGVFGDAKRPVDGAVFRSGIHARSLNNFLCRYAADSLRHFRRKVLHRFDKGFEILCTGPNEFIITEFFLNNDIRHCGK